MSLAQILKNKDAYTQSLLKNFNTIWDGMAPSLQREVTALFRSNNYSITAIENVFTELGFDDLSGEVAIKINKMMQFSADMSKELGYSFMLGRDNIQVFDELSQLNVETLLNTKRQIANDLKRFALRAELEGLKFKDIAAGLKDTFDEMGRRLNTEIYTGIRTFESALDKVSMINGGIEKFKYVGPVDSKNRDACQATLQDKRQETGWTAEEVENSNTPFIERGGWNCRHRWVAYVEG